MNTHHHRNWKRAKGLRVVTLALFLFLILSLGLIVQQRITSEKAMILTVSDSESRELYRKEKVSAGDILEFGWEHSFEHVPWIEYYEVLPDGRLKLYTIAVGGFGAGIPAEMDCTYRYEEDLIYMENLEDSIFERLTWIHSQTQVKYLRINDKVIFTGEDMPQRAKLMLEITP